MSIQLHALPVRAGDATLLLDRRVVHHQTAILIDAGHNKDDAMTALDELGIKRIDLLVVSHIDLDHIGGMESILDNVDVRQIWCFDIYRLKDALTSSPSRNDNDVKQPIDPFVHRLITADKFLKRGFIKGIPCFHVEQGHTETVEGFALEVLWPPSSFVDYVLQPKNLSKYFSEKRPLTDWVLDETLRLAECGDDHPKLDRGEAQRLAKSRLAEREMEYEAYDADNAEHYDDGAVSWPGEKFANNLSIVLRITPVGQLPSTPMLFSGDLEDWTTILTTHSPRLRAPVWKIPHHGSEHVGFDFSPYFEEKYIHELLSRMPPGPWMHWLDWYHDYHRRGKRGRHFPFPPLPPTPFGMAGGFALHNSLSSQMPMTGDAADIARIVEPAKSLVYPFPARGLPSLKLESGVCWGEVITNRKLVRGAPLHDKANEPADTLLTLTR
ncbi:MAG: MBL fold metallo-hydrolase [Planctomycetes bacterium]|nr:MBL fold metallo-hydrolase [Planctomycetota bacterium]